MDYAESGSTLPDPFQLGVNTIATALGVSTDKKSRILPHFKDICLTMTNFFIS